MSVLVLLVVIAAAGLLGLVVGIEAGRQSALRMIRKVNADRRIEDQATGADLIRQVERRQRG